MASSSYDGDAVSGSAARAALPQGQMQVTDTIMTGDGDGGEIGGDTTVALTGNTATRVRKPGPGKRRTVAGSVGSKAANPKAGSHAITTTKASSSLPASSSNSITVRDFVSARELAPYQLVPHVKCMYKPNACHAWHAMIAGRACHACMHGMPRMPCITCMQCVLCMHACMHAW